MKYYQEPNLSAENNMNFILSTKHIFWRDQNMKKKKKGQPTLDTKAGLGQHWCINQNLELGLPMGFRKSMIIIHDDHGDTLFAQLIKFSGPALKTSKFNLWWEHTLIVLVNFFAIYFSQMFVILLLFCTKTDWNTIMFLQIDWSRHEIMLGTFDRSYIT